jgi:transcriptional regulator with XRE-family HTH domain
MKFIDYYKDTVGEVKEDFEFEVSFLITELRLKFGLTQAGLAKKIGTKQPSIARMESGVELPSLRILKKIADALKVKIIPPKFDFATQGTIETMPLGEEIPSSYFKLSLLPISESSKTEEVKKSFINN